ncbi:nicotinamide riboside kinase 2 isoform X5 [Cavia porcellus]|uniref:nicotinamide riboside kinase 2 isoform X5 n=1 Tax=Cavia porcellus TaxID=10141 RepID=UPI002FE3997B
MKIIVGIGGVTNGGKTTLANSLCKALPNCCVIHQDDFFKPQDQIAVGEDGFKQWDALESLDMEAMLGTVQDWLHSPQKFARAHGVCLQPDAPDTHVLLLDGFLLYSYRPLLDLYSRRYFLTVPYEECKCRRSTHSYPISSTPELFDGHVWPMYQKYKQEMEAAGVDVGKVPHWGQTGPRGAPQNSQESGLCDSPPPVPSCLSGTVSLEKVPTLNPVLRIASPILGNVSSCMLGVTISPQVRGRPSGVPFGLPSSLILFG